MHLDQQIEVDERVERERRIPNPCIAVVVVAIAPDPLRQRRRRRGDDRTRRHVGEQSKGKRAPASCLVPLALDARVGEPALPVIDGVGEPRLDPVAACKRNRLVVGRAQDE